MQCVDGNGGSVVGRGLCARLADSVDLAGAVCVAVAEIGGVGQAFVGVVFGRVVIAV